MWKISCKCIHICTRINTCNVFIGTWHKQQGYYILLYNSNKALFIVKILELQIETFLLMCAVSWSL